jgi:hypothetical protein
MLLRRLKYTFTLPLYGFLSADTAWDSHSSNETGRLLFADHLTASDTQLLTSWLSLPKSTADLTFLRMKSHFTFSRPHWVEAPAFFRNTDRSGRSLGASVTEGSSFFFQPYRANHTVQHSALFEETILSLNNEAPDQIRTDGPPLKKVY